MVFLTFGEKLLVLRKSKGMSQEQLAAQITVSRQAISKWELGESLPDTDNVIQLSKLFGVSIDYLLNDEFRSEPDIPTVTESKVHFKNAYHNKILKTLAIVIGIVGAAGMLILWILSTMIEVHVTKSYVWPNGTKTYYGGGDILGYNFWAFISEYRLMAIFWVLLVLMLSGAFLLITFKKYGKKTVDDG